MKNLSMIILMAIVCHNLNAQETFEIRKSLKNSDKLALEFKFADSILINKWDKDEIYVKALVNININKDNDHFSFNSEMLGDVLHIESEINELNKLSENRKVKDLETGEIIEMDCHIQMDLFYEVFVPNNTNVSLKTISGNIKSIDLDSKQKLHSISGDIDFYLPEKARVDLEMRTISGEMYTNFDFPVADKEYRSFVSIEMEHKINGGGKTLELETISGNIYLRKLE